MFRLFKIWTFEKCLSAPPVSRKDIVTSEDLQKWPHLCDVHISTIDSDVDLLIGVNFPKVMEPWDVISSADEGPFAVKTALGWVIKGPLDVGPDSSTCTYNTYVTVNRIDARLEKQVRYQFNQGFCERVIDDVPDDKRFLEFVTNSVCFENGHYVIGLPFKSESVTMPNNK